MKKLFQLGTMRTNNFTDPDMAARIGALWQQATSLGLDGATYYGIYHHYDSDFHGDYDVTIAADKAPETDAPIMLLNTDAHFRRFDVKIDDPADTGLAVFNTWQTIWAAPLTRSYTQDFEVYHPNGRIEIFIAVEE